MRMPLSSDIIHYNMDTKQFDILKNILVYIIDDSRSFTLGIESIISSYGCRVKSFNDPENALDVIFQEHPDIIITDLEMPKLSGLDLIKKIREQNELSIIPILVMTSKDSQMKLVECLIEGADAFASKVSLQSVLIANIVALMRVAKLRKRAIATKQFDAIKALIGTYKHEFGNTLAIMDGKLHKLVKEIPEITEKDAYKSIQNAMVRFNDTLAKLSALREYKEEEYSEGTSILKI
jgi:DNA-binding response OmpR family regulator